MKPGGSTSDRSLRPASDGRRISRVGLRARNLERRYLPNSGDGSTVSWYTVGTPDQVAGLTDSLGNSIADLIALNPAPWDADPWIPLLNDWNHAADEDGVLIDGPVAFALFPGSLLRLEGGFTGGTPGTAIYQLPDSAFFPPYRTPLIMAMSDLSDAYFAVAQPDGFIVDGEAL